jgi:transcriptional regulator with XRE-family HTH domain
MITPQQIRAARGLLDWTREELASFSEMTPKTLMGIEKGTTSPRQSNLQKLTTILENAGVEFLPGNGVRLRNEMVQVFEGDDANQRLLDDVYNTLRDTGGEVLISGLEESSSVNDLELEGLQKHLGRLIEAGISERILIKEGDTNFVAPKHWYRAVPVNYFNPVPFQTYGSKIAMILWSKPEHVVIVDHPEFAASYRSLFNFVWDHANKIKEGEEE